MKSCKEASTPMPSSCYMDADVAGKEVDQTKYGGLIGSLLYFTASRPDIMFFVCLCARFKANPKENLLIFSKNLCQRTSFVFLRNELGILDSQTLS